MTIAAGYLASDGILICADTEHSDEVAKYRKQKAFRIKDYAMVTGSGTSHLISVASERIARVMPESPSTENAALDIVEAVVSRLHKDHIFKYYDASSHARPTLNLIVGVRCVNGKLALIKTQDTTATMGASHVSTGNGEYLFEYWASHFFDRQLRAEAASYLILFIMREVKDHVTGCGGESQVHILPLNPNHSTDPEWLHEDEILAGFPGTAAQVLVDAIDYPATPDFAFARDVKQFDLAVAKLRERFQSKYLEAIRRLQSTKDDQKYPPPSRE
jgi:20S proteasome alpha/beta subunit